MTSILIMIITTIFLFGMAILAMAVGLIFTKKPLHHNGCGGKVDTSGNFVPCDSCSTINSNNDLHKMLADDDFMKTFGQFARK